MSTTMMTETAPSVPALLYGVLGVWFVTAMVLVASGATQPVAGEAPLVLLAMVLTPVLVYALLWRFKDGFRDWVLGIDMRLLIALHAFRMIGMSFVFLWFYDLLPAVFAFPAGLGDAAAAAGALWIALMLYSGLSLRRSTVRRWNTFGLVDFVIAVSFGALSAAGLPLDFGSGVTSAPMTAFPLAIIPGFFVPLFVITHLAIYSQLGQGRSGVRNLVD